MSIYLSLNEREALRTWREFIRKRNNRGSVFKLDKNAYMKSNNIVLQLAQVSKVQQNSRETIETQ